MSQAPSVSMPCVLGAAVGAFTIIFTADLSAREAHYSLHDDASVPAAVVPHPTPKPTASPTPKPTASPTPLPTSNPTASPTPLPTSNPTAYPTPKPTASPAALFKKPPAGTNQCAGAKPSGLVNLTTFGQGMVDFSNTECFKAGVQEQAGADVTKGFKGTKATTVTPITEPYYKKGLCPVNVHWHLGAEHRSAGEYDETGTGPTEIAHRRKLAGKVRQGMQCKKFDKADAKFTKPFDWKFCKDMEVGQTYEVHWPHSSLGACKSVNQYQTPFYDGVFCNLRAALEGGLQLTPQNIASSVGVQAQVFTIVNDESFYYPDLMRGMIVDGDHGKDMAIYTGSTTGTSRNNKICSMYAPITWQVDRTCHLISASTFDKMCADMSAQRDDMSDDFHAHGSRELVAKNLTANNQQSL